MKSLFIDIKDITSKMYDTWDGNGTFSRFLNKKTNKDYIISEIKKLIGDGFNQDKWELSIKNKELKIRMEWQQKENINAWQIEQNEKIRKATNTLWEKGLNAYIL